METKGTKAAANVQTADRRVELLLSFTGQGYSDAWGWDAVGLSFGLNGPQASYFARLMRGAYRNDARTWELYDWRAEAVHVIALADFAAGLDAVPVPPKRK